jgi:hypothetical protein
VALPEGLRRRDGPASEPSSLSNMMISDDTGSLEEFPRGTGRLGRRDGRWSYSSSSSSTSMTSWRVRRLGIVGVEAPSTVPGISPSISYREERALEAASSLMSTLKLKLWTAQ